MRLSPVLLAAVAIAAPLGGSLSANAETANNSKQSTEVLTLEKNQHSEKDTGQVNSSKSLESQPKSTATIEAERPQSRVVAIYPANPAASAAPKVIVPTSTTPRTAQTPEINNPSPTQQPSPAPDIPPPEIQQPTLSPTPETTPVPENVNPPTTEPLLPTTPEPSATPDIPPPASQQRTPTLFPGATPSPQNVNPPTTPGNTPFPGTTPSPQNVNPPTTPGNTPFPGTTPSPQNVNPPTTPDNTQPNTAPEANDPRVLVSEVVVRSQAGQLSPELESQVYRVIRTQPGQTTTRSQLQEDINAIFGTGFFSNVQAAPEDTPLGVRVSFVVQPNPVLSKVEVQANPGTGVPSVLPANTVDEVFREQYGKILNLRDLQEGIKQLNKRYQDQGYVLANVIGAPQVSESGVVTLQVAEGVVENIRVRFRNKDGQETDEKGQPIRGRTQEYIITREVELKPGQVFNRNTVQKDLQRVYGLGLFEDVNVSLDPGTDPSKVDVVVNVAERSSGSIAAGAGISSASGLFGTVSYQQQNLNGRNQKLGTEIQVGERELLFDVRFTDPWIAGDPYRTSYTTNIFRRSSISLIFDGKDEDIRTFDPGNPTDVDSQDRPRILRVGGGVTFTRPLSANPYKTSVWTASAGLQYQRVSARDADGNLRKTGAVFDDDTGNRLSDEIPLTLSSGGQDDLLLLQVGAQRDLRNNPLQPTSGSYLRFGVDQSVPVGLGNIFLTRFRGSYSQYLPIKLISLSKGAQTLAFNLQAGTIIGDLPPYEAFTLGGSNSVRGYEEGALGSGRSYVQASVEYRFPVFSVVSGALFFDLGSDLGTSTRAAEVLNKNGSGFGYGLGVRVQSPLGPIRIDYGINDDGDSRINFGIGERF
ncbi:MAG: BamA/TamA family outer membrane protein [Nostoc sp. DedQUE08]|uniref:BamA/TamA family outer membrane protein n=1 Tax=unclassified Nostoc TaxID=2593658 RepID=UPI002AD52F0E|nr:MULTISPECIES: BamA/TamA family outer membrane protein [unclassified Nostoc]MDZ8034109.1 BamA/TamA family outer membrane protein [Nostoc sp. DedSLP04]MDZ8066585.1 BamA/TamA family outer membrane protein [Nostoc sp. DedQUE08]MDZ8138764.1 BamA/TamA family outer membrane protein [Nostoc sp. DedQUE04]